MPSDGLRDAVVAALPPHIPELAHEAVPGLGRPNSDGWAPARCPFHEDESASFGLNLKHGGFRCQALACDAHGDFLDLWGRTHNDMTFPEVLRDLAGRVGVPIPERTPRPSAKASLGQPEAVYQYTEADGTLRYSVLRFRDPATGRKQIRQKAADGSWSVRGIAALPYRLPELQEAIATDRVVLIGEGEKVVEKARELGFVATTNSGGAGKFAPELVPYFTDADVLLIPDNDQAGRKHMLDVASKLAGVARRVRWLDLPGLEAKGDLADWDGDAAELARLIEEAGEPPVEETVAAPYPVSDIRKIRDGVWAYVGQGTPPTDPPPGAGPGEWHGTYYRDAGYEPFDSEREDATPRPARYTILTDAQVEALPPVQFLVDRVLPRNAMAMAYGPPAIGKSFWSIDLACSVATGLPFMGRVVEKGACVYIAAEGASGLGQRLRAWKEHRRWSDPVGVGFVAETVDMMQHGSVLDFLEAVETMAEPPKLVVVDTLARAMVGGDDNSAQDTSVLIAHCDLIRQATGAAVLLVHHPRKDGASYRGSLNLLAGMDTCFQLEPKDGGVLLSVTKQKDAEPLHPVRLKLTPIGESAVLVTANELGSNEPRTLPDFWRAALGCLAVTNGLSASAWERQSGLPSRTFYRVRNELLTNTYVQLPTPGRGALYYLTDLGRQALTANCQLTANALHGSDPNSLPPAPSLLEGAGVAVRGHQGDQHHLDSLLSSDLPADVLEDLRAARDQPDSDRPVPQSLGH